METFKKILGVVGFAVGGAVIGFGIVSLSGDAVRNFLGGDAGVVAIIIAFVIILAVIYLAALFHIIAHEAGHLLGGRLGGYEFVFFRVGSFTLVKKDGKLVRKSYNIGGTGGQCIMAPPPPKGEDFKFPFMVYFLAGGTVNILLGGGFLVAGLFTGGIASAVFMSFAIVGVAVGLLNLIPMKFGGIPNDGYNAVVCAGRMKTRRAMWIQLTFVAEVTRGVRPHELPEEWGLDIGEITDALVGFLPSLRHAWLMESGEFEAANEYAKEVLQTPGKMLPLHQNSLRCEMLFHELTHENRREEVERMYTKEVKELFTLLAGHLATLRVQYALAVLYDKDDEKARKLLEKFNKACDSHPLEGEVPGERAWIELVKPNNLKEEIK